MTRGMNQIQELQGIIDRQLVVQESGIPLELRAFNLDIVQNQAQFGVAESDLESMFIAHNNSDEYYFNRANTQILGIREETRRRFLLNCNEQEIDVVSKDPAIVTTWIGERVRLLTLSEARQRVSSGKSAYNWAKRGGPDDFSMVVAAQNGLFYKAMSRDKVLPLKEGQRR